MVPPESWSTVFFYRFCTDLIADLAIPPLTSVLMSKNIWIPLLGAVFFQGSCAAMLLILPETSPLPMPEDAGRPLMATTTSEPEDYPKSAKWWKHKKRRARDSFSFVQRDSAVAALVLTFLISKVGRQSTNVLLQYASKRYGWTLSQVCAQFWVPLLVTNVIFNVGWTITVFACGCEHCFVCPHFARGCFFCPPTCRFSVS